MQKFSSIAVVGLLLLLLAGVGHAEIYRYRDASGRWVISNTPPPASAAAVVSQETVRAPEPEPVSEVPPAPPAAPGQQVVVVTQPQAQPETEPPKPRARAVDTREFGLLREGDSMGQVLQRLGPPMHKQEQGEVSTISRSRSGRLIKSTAQVETWYYPGDGYSMPVRLVFHNGILVQKVKEQ